MLDQPKFYQVTDYDQQVFNTLVPKNHFLNKALSAIPWDEFTEFLNAHYSADLGRPSCPPLVMLKFEYLRYHHNLSDREVISRAQTDVAFRQFFQLSLRAPMPDHSSLCRFRGRLGLEAFRKIFDKVVALARKQGFVKDRLRVKDATHIIGNIAVPSTLALVAQTRDKLLEVAKPFAPTLVVGEEVNLELLRDSTKKLSDLQRLAARVEHLSGMLDWVKEIPAPPDASQNSQWQRLLIQRDLAEKILGDRAQPEQGDKTLSTADPDVRRGRHGHFYDGYMMDILVDSDSEIITQINVLPANGNESMDTVTLLEREQDAHGNEIEAVSIDGAGFSGPLLRKLEDPEGLNVKAFVPIPTERSGNLFTIDDFVENPESGTVTCPAGLESNPGSHSAGHDSTRYRFTASGCRVCALLAKCMKTSPKTCGRTICKSDYLDEHQRAKNRATTEAFREVRREHPKVERKLGEVVNCHRGRRAHYFGIDKVAIQETMAGMATNIKRLVKLTCARVESLATI